MNLLRKVLSEYYLNTDLVLPQDYMLREFAFQDLIKGVFIRHLSFQSLPLLKDYLVKNTPKQAFYSSAIYRDPAAERMEDKGWLGSELFFDIDADHISGCDFITLDFGEGRSLKLIKPKCIELAKEHELKLIDILKYDFGFTDSEIRITFSGNRGFHTIVRPKDDSWLKLDSKARRELVDYIKAKNLDLTRLIPHSLRRNIKLMINSIDFGILRRISSWCNLNNKHLLSINEIESVLSNIIVEVDEQVTTDISRLIRIPNTINGKTGIPSLVIKSESDLVSFEYGPHLSPFSDSYALIKPLTSLPSKIEFLGEVITIPKSSYPKIPLHLAVLLALNGLAEIVNIY